MTSLSVANSMVKYLEQKIWEGVAQCNIEKLAPTSAKLQAFQVLDSHITNEIQSRQAHENFGEDYDPKGISMDTFTVNGAQIEPNNN